MHETDLKNIFGNVSYKELFEVLDDKSKGYLLEDNILLMFNIILVITFKFSNKLIIYNFYQKSKLINEKSKILSLLLEDYQNYIRDKINEKNIEDYLKIGKLNINKTNYFNYVKSSKLEKLNKYKLNTLKNKFNIKKNKILNNNQDLKLNYNLKLNQNILEKEKMEKLIALDGKFEEAKLYRKDIKILKNSLKNHFSKEINEKINTKIKKLVIKTKKKKNYFERSYEADKNKFKIDKMKSYDLNLKKASIYENKIKNVQNRAKKFVNKQFRQDLNIREYKEILNKKEKIINLYKKKIHNIQRENHKSINFENSSIFTAHRNRSIFLDNSERNITVKNSFTKVINDDLIYLKKIKNSKYINKFYLKNKIDQDIPINKNKVKDLLMKNNYNEIAKYIKIKKESGEDWKLCELYNDELKQIY